jgi:hypothetical protein
MEKRMKFSERQGSNPVSTVIQTKSMNQVLRNRLWSVIVTLCFDNSGRAGYTNWRIYPDYKDLFPAIWHNYFKEPLDTIPNSFPQVIARLREDFFECKWYEAYDFIEFIATTHPYKNTRQSFMPAINDVLEEELSGYRFIDGKLAPITAEQEVAAVQRAVDQTGSAFPFAAKHLQVAIAMLAQKPKPDFRNSIKESISAVESLCATVTGDPKATLGQALKVIYSDAELHGALRAAFEKLYGYTSDANGIRHGLMDEPNLELEDATFMLIACSAFVSYVIAKRARKALA